MTIEHKTLSVVSKKGREIFRLNMSRNVACETYTIARSDRTGDRIRIRRPRFYTKPVDMHGQPLVLKGRWVAELIRIKRGVKSTLGIVATGSSPKSAWSNASSILLAK